MKEEPVVICATADTDHYIPASSLPTTSKHYITYTNLCSTTKDTLETVYNLSTAYDLQQSSETKACGSSGDPLQACGTLDNLSSSVTPELCPYQKSNKAVLKYRHNPGIYIPFDHTAIFWTAVQPYRTYNTLPSG